MIVLSKPYYRDEEAKSLTVLVPFFWDLSHEFNCEVEDYFIRLGYAEAENIPIFEEKTSCFCGCSPCVCDDDIPF